MIIYHNPATGEIIWLCSKCKKLRSNKITHKHGEGLPIEKIKQLKEMMK